MYKWLIFLVGIGAGMALLRVVDKFRVLRASNELLAGLLETERQYRR